MDIVILAIIAGAIAYKLYNALGNEEGLTSSPARKKSGIFNPTAIKSNTKKKSSIFNTKAKNTNNVIDAQFTDITNEDISELSKEMQEVYKEVKQRHEYLKIKDIKSYSEIFLSNITEALSGEDISIVKDDLSQDFLPKVEFLIEESKKEEEQDIDSVIEISNIKITDIKEVKNCLWFMIEVESTQVGYSKNRHTEKLTSGSKTAQFKTTDIMAISANPDKETGEVKWYLEALK